MVCKIITFVMVLATVSFAQEVKTPEAGLPISVQPPRAAVAVPLPALVHPKNDKVRQKRQVAIRPLPAFIPSRNQNSGFNNGGFAPIRTLPIRVTPNVRPQPAYNPQHRAIVDNNFGQGRFF